MKYIDIHGHINFPEYDADREETIKRAHDAGVGMITVGVGHESSKQAIQLAETHENMWAVVGIHPTDTNSDVADAEFEGIKELAKHPKVVAIGECGLDYFHSKPEDMAKQKELFEKHIALANETGKPLMLHVRNGRANEGTHAKAVEDTALSLGGKNDEKVVTFSTSQNAYQEAIAILKKSASAKTRGNFHFFAGSLQDAKDIVQMGYTMSFTGVLTFARNYDEIVKEVPLSSIMSETDCPYVAPIPFRGKRCEPVHVMETVKKIAEIRGESTEVVERSVLDNAKNFFHLN